MKKTKTFNLTAKRIEALRFIDKHPGTLVQAIAYEVLATKYADGTRRHMWSQAATRMGAGYCIPLQREGYITIDVYNTVGYGKATITPKGIAALAAQPAKDDSLDAAIARSVE